MTVLQSIVSGVLEDLAQRQLSESQISELLAAAPRVRKPLAELSKTEFAVIAEVKRSSPSKGVLAQISNPEVLAQSYEAGGASIVSVLTEKRRFGGSLEDLQVVRNSISIPVLRKDFIVNEYLVKESRAFGADLMLLIVAAVDSSQLKDLYQCGKELGMDVLVEVHSESELEIAMTLDPQIIGVNSRNLKTLEIDLANFANLIPKIPGNIYKVAESGISTKEDVLLARNSGANAILVGESLVKSGNPVESLAEFLNVAKNQ